MRKNAANELENAEKTSDWRRSRVLSYHHKVRRKGVNEYTSFSPPSCDP
ncbi:MAG TPA: hypothetical protein VFY68_15425 [Nitrososphaeraceae archaeon]|nr:hypothetical protein [Nitrososphaeraceae archaeon]